MMMMMMILCNHGRASIQVALIFWDIVQV